ncbi:MAG: hypothetical protein AAB554_04025 [Patescibacteria group bacterium]
MKVLKPSVVAPVRLVPFLVAVAVAFVVFFSYTIGHSDGEEIGYDLGLHASGDDEQRAHRAAARILRATQPQPAPAVVMTETRTVVCEDVERAYDACVADMSCAAERLGVLGQDILTCETPAESPGASSVRRRK